VVGPNASEFTKPLVSLLTTESGTLLGKNAVAQIDLSRSDEKIIEALPNFSISHHVLDGF
jgi:hypothetical protein